MNKILLIDDDHEFVSLLEELLNIEGFSVSVIHDRSKVLNILDEQIDLILLSILISKKNGIEIIKTIRKTYQTPIIMLATCGNKLERTLCLEFGADDYLSKPFNDRELIARIKSVLRRSNWRFHQLENNNIKPILIVDSLNLNPGRQEASFDGQRINLTGTEFTLLYLLARYLGQVVSREYLSQNVLGKRLTPFDRAIDMHISNLRRKLPKRKDGYPWFKTLRRRGYLMVSTS